MRYTGVSNCEKAFLLQSFVEDARLDGRTCEQYRELKISLGIESGSCFAELGHTKVFVQVSSEIVSPKAARPNSGELFVNVEMSPMAAPNLEAGRLGESGIKITRLLERLLKESSCVDVESLCIIAGEKVWQIRIDVHVIDHDGAIVDCASIASVCALKSFRRNDVTIIGENFVVHSIDDKEPVPLTLFHVPVCCTFGLAEQGSCIIVDPLEIEEQVFEEEIIIAMNSHKELCTIHCSGGLLLQKQQIMRCCSMAMRRAKEVNDLIVAIFQKDTVDRSKKQKIGLSSLISVGKVTTSAYNLPSTCCQLGDVLSRIKNDHVANAFPASAAPYIRRKGKRVEIGDKCPSLLTKSDSDEDVQIVEEIRESSSFRAKIVKPDDAENKEAGKNKRRQRKEKDKNVLQLLKDMEDDVVILSPAESKKAADFGDDVEIVEDFKLSAALKKPGRKQERRKLQ